MSDFDPALRLRIEPPPMVERASGVALLDLLLPWRWGRGPARRDIPFAKYAAECRGMQHSAAP
jgi:hypothetical protein